MASACSQGDFFCKGRHSRSTRAWMAFSSSLSMFVSQGVMASVRASIAFTVATPSTAVGVP